MGPMNAMCDRIDLAPAWCFHLALAGLLVTILVVAWDDWRVRP
jgi:hypothetical protein